MSTNKPLPSFVPSHKDIHPTLKEIYENRYGKTDNINTGFYPTKLSSPLASVSSSRAPSPPLSSCIVKLHDLKKNTELNGKIAIVGENIGERYYVVPIKKDGEMISVLPDKFTPASLSEIQEGGRKRKSHKNKYSKQSKRTKRTKQSKQSKRTKRTKRTM